MMDLLQLFRHSEDGIAIAAGQMIFKEGDPGDLMYVVLAGEIQITLNDKIIETLSAGEILGELALVDHNPRSANAIAKTDCVLVPISERRFLFLVQETPYFALHVMSVMAKRLRQRTLELVRS
jgi:CRP/FNR family transcriptional regulator, cyclic AMP receptor protein